MNKIHPFKVMSLGTDTDPDKTKLREEIITKTKLFIQKKSITILPDSPNAKVPEVRIRDMGQFHDAHEFYVMEEQDDNIHQDLNNI